MISCEENKNKRQNSLHVYCFNWVHAEKNNTTKRKHLSLRCIISPYWYKIWETVWVYTIDIKNSLRKIQQYNLVLEKKTNYNIQCMCYIKIYYFITDLLLMFTSLTRHIQWLMICLLKLPGFGESLLLLHALIAFRFILNKSWDRRECVLILGLNFVKCFS